MDHMKPVFRLTLIILFLLSSCTSSVSTPTSIPTETQAAVNPTEAVPALLNEAKLAQFEGYAAETMRLMEVPGMSIAVVENGKVIYAKGFGVRALGSDDPVDLDTLMLIASTSKPLTSVMMATLVDDGLMQWNTPVTSILPAFAVGDAELTKKLTMHDLVCACSGMPAKNSALFLSGLERAEEMINLLQYTKPVARIDEKYIYNNMMFASGGYISGLVAGGPGDNLDAGYLSAMQKRVFEPVGMTRTTLSLDTVQASENFAMPHGRDLALHYQLIPLSSENFLTSIKPAGGIWSTANDLSRLMITLLEQGIAPSGEQVISTSNLEHIWQPGVRLGKGENPSYYGMGWFIDDYQGRRMVSHGGNSMGFSTEFALLPDSGIGIVILTNAQSATSLINALRNRFLELAFDLPFTYDAEFRSDVEGSRQDFLDFAGELKPGFNEQAISPFLGTFSNQEIGEINIQVKEGKLRLYSDGLSMELCQYTGREVPYVIACEIPLLTFPLLVFEFKMEAGGTPAILLHESGLTEPYIFEKLDTP